MKIFTQAISLIPELQIHKNIRMPFYKNAHL